MKRLRTLTTFVFFYGITMPLLCFADSSNPFGIDISGFSEGSIGDMVKPILKVLIIFCGVMVVIALGQSIMGSLDDYRNNKESVNLMTKLVLPTLAIVVALGLLGVAWSGVDGASFS